MSNKDDDKSSFQTAESHAATFHTAGSGEESPSGPSLVRILSGAKGPIVDSSTSAGVEAQAVTELAAYGLDRRPSRRERSASNASSRRAIGAATRGRDEEKTHTAPSEDGGDGSADTAVGEEALDDDEVPPGLKGWLDLLGTVMSNMLCYGMTQSFAVFQQYYAHHLLSEYSTSTISWIGAIQFCLCPLLGCISGPLFDAGYLKHLIIFGGTLYVLCLMMASISTQYYQLLLSHGFGVGIAMGSFFSPSVGTLSHHFSKSRYRTFAYGMQASGSAVAGIVFPSILNALLPRVGFPWTMRILGFIVAGFMIIIFFTLSTTVPPRKKIAVLSPAVFRNPAYSIYVMAACSASMAIYAPLNFSVTYATSRGVPLEKANYAPAISNGVSIVGRIVPLIIAQRLGPINVLTTFSCISGISQFMWTLARSTTGILIYDAFYGIASGGYGASLNPGAASFAPHTNQAGLYLGMCFFVTSFFWLVGTPISAALIDSNKGYLAASMFGGSVLLLAFSLFVVSRRIRVKQVGTKFV
ncbi:hypothetical protein Q8F55_002296 [Vanrija albida]|uniref:Major facilitator superfamily (MFS) profile domain-containing protein n=1 Tax=Vanrija albida TaxID=181172 RepID=A0ABR3Q9E3_9TREE